MYARTKTMTNENELFQPSKILANVEKKPFFTVPEVAKIFGVDPNTVRQWLQRKHLEYFPLPLGTEADGPKKKPYGNYRISYESLVAMIERQQATLDADHGSTSGPIPPEKDVQAFYERAYRSHH